MKNKVLIVYQFATFGGVERMLLNRAEAFKSNNMNYKLYVYFYENYGSISALKRYIIQNNLAEYIEIIEKFKPSDYDFIVSIDTPQIFENPEIKVEDIYLETHTFEKKNRKYLNKYKNKVRKVIVPSQTFYEQISLDLKPFNKASLKILNNFVPWDIKQNNNDMIEFPEWNKKILFYFGRMDENKNIKELINGFKNYYEKYSKDIILILIGEIDPEYKLEKFVEEEKMTGKILFLPPIDFNQIDLLLNSLKKYKSIFLSSSKGETFGLSSAEAITHDIPIILSNIPAHKELVQNNNELLYELNNPKELAIKIDSIFNKYDTISSEIKKLKNNISAKKFISDWIEIFNSKTN